MIRTTLLALTVALMVSFTAGVALAKTINGTSGNDVITGTESADVIKAGLGNDRVSARGGNDYVDGMAGVDTIFGAAGNDNLLGGTGNDLIGGSDGNDTIRGNTEDDRLRGGAGDDKIYSAGDAGTDYVNCEGGDNDSAFVSANDFVDGVEAATLTVNSGLSCENIFVNGIRVPNA